MLKYLKIPVGLVRKANHNQSLSILIKYYQLKENCLSGRYINIKSIALALGLDVKSTYPIVLKMLRLSLIKKDKMGIYFLRSYNHVWSLYGYDLSICKNSKGYNKKGNFKIFKLKINQEFNDNFEKAFIKYVSLLEIRHNLNKQKVVISKKLTKLNKEDILKLKGLIQKNPKLEGYYIDIAQAFDINIFPLLSCQGIAYLLGYASKSSGYKLLQNLIDSSLIKVKKMFDESNRHLCNLINFNPSSFFNFLFKRTDSISFQLNF